MTRRVHLVVSIFVVLLAAPGAAAATSPALPATMPPPRCFSATIGQYTWVASGVGGTQNVRTTKHPVAHVLNPGTEQERAVMMRPLIVDNVRES